MTGKDRFRIVSWKERRIARKCQGCKDTWKDGRKLIKKHWKENKRNKVGV